MEECGYMSTWRHDYMPSWSLDQNKWEKIIIRGPLISFTLHRISTDLTNHQRTPLFFNFFWSKGSKGLIHIRTVSTMCFCSCSCSCSFCSWYPSMWTAYMVCFYYTSMWTASMVCFYYTSMWTAYMVCFYYTSMWTAVLTVDTHLWTVYMMLPRVIFHLGRWLPNSIPDHTLPGPLWEYIHLLPRMGFVYRMLTDPKILSFI